MVALVGDAELDEGNIFECLLEGWKQGLRNCWWIIDYNRQSLDAVVREGLYQRITALFEAMGWQVVVLKYGSLLEEAFREPGGPARRGRRGWGASLPRRCPGSSATRGAGPSTARGRSRSSRVWRTSSARRRPRSSGRRSRSSPGSR